jgi:hypothetical protein
MPADTDRLARWIERGLAAKGDLTLAEVVAEGRAKGDAWATIAADIANRSGETCTQEWLRVKFGAVKSDQIANGAGAHP